MKKYELGIKLYQASFQKGKFTTKQGTNVKHRFNKNKFLTDPVLVKELALQMEMLVPQGVDYLAGAAPTSFALATAVSLEMGIKTVMVRKNAGNKRKCVVGNNVTDKKVCIIVDVLSSVKATIALVENLRNAGATVDTVICAVRKNAEAPEQLKEQGIQLIQVFTMKYLKELIASY